MHFRLSTPVNRKGTRNHQLVKRLPLELRERMVGMRLDIPIGDEPVKTVTISPSMQAVRVSLGTADPAEVKLRQGEALGYLERVFAAVRTGAPVSLSHRQVVALSGRLYRSWASSEPGRGERVMSVSVGGDDDGTWDINDGDELVEWAAVFASLIARLDNAADKGDLEPVVGSLIDRLLLAEGIASVDGNSRRMLLVEFARALRDAWELRKRQAGGDYSPDPKAERFPEWVSPASSKPASRKGSLTDIVEGWWGENKGRLKVPTYEGYRNTMKKLVAFVGHDDPAQLTRPDVLRFKDQRLADGISINTVRDNDLVGLRAVFEWAVGNDRMASNPAKGITLKRAKPVRLREKSFRPDEAKAILKAALGERHLGRRWVPWLMAYTGARVGEIGQLRRKDVVRIEDGPGGEERWAIVITPEAGTVKTNEARAVPLHPHLVDLGFIEFATKIAKLKSPQGHLFIRPNPKTGDVRGPLRGFKTHLAKFVRNVVPDPNVQPNHAWRHLFITECRRQGIDEGTALMKVRLSPDTGERASSSSTPPGRSMITAATRAGTDRETVRRIRSPAAVSTISRRPCANSVANSKGSGAWWWA
jgi:integrase